MELQNEKSRVLGVVRIVVSFAAIVVCFYLMVVVGRQGISRAMQTAATIQTSLEAADYNISLTPGDPEAHYTRAIVLGNQQRLTEATTELREAIRLRPHHYYEWLDLAVTLDRLGDEAGAKTAVNTSIRLAPSFAQPRWQLGNLLFREGKYDEAFTELRLGAASNINLVPSMLAMALAATDGDVSGAEALVQPADARMHLEFARFLAAQGKGADAARHVRAAGDPLDENERGLFYQTVASLVGSQNYADAYLVWAARHPDVDQQRMKGLLNADFSQPIVKDEPGFGWQLPMIPNLSVSIDPAGPQTGGRSLRLHFTGDSDTSADLVRQLLVIEPQKRYALTFWARSNNLVSGGPPAVYVVDAAHTDKILGQSRPLTTGTTGWENLEIDFSAVADTSGVAVVLHRVPCNAGTCPIFGEVWLGGFSLRKL